MRLLVRFALAILICLLLIAAYEYLNIRQRVISRNDPTTDADEVVRILLMSDDPASSWETNVNVTFNVIVVLIISLLSIALLVTVIGSESYNMDETTIGLQQEQTICASQFLSSTDRLLPPIGIITNLNKHSVSSINEI
ncbi:unnamed protein product [Brugia pahangi]|uniref:Col_cuticle_N domain-containing protein n=1 Tax=Brugia pahangi TaxID=6280 RepID=A0A0N4TTU6_BRUPA|nr:unnamed protein product [Brugia pahangi]